jgi:hypothetical protein
MRKLEIEAKESRAIGYPESPVIPVTMNVMGKAPLNLPRGETYKTLIIKLYE